MPDRLRLVALKNFLSVKDLLGKQMDALARKFAATHDTKVKEEIERLGKEYGKLKQTWVFVAR
jgi:hypothetical protein